MDAEDNKHNEILEKIDGLSKKTDDLSDRRLIALIKILVIRRVISHEDANAVLALEPFPQSR